MKEPFDQKGPVQPIDIEEAGTAPKPKDDKPAEDPAPETDQEPGAHGEDHD